MLRKILAQEKAISILENSIRNERIANSYLFYGPDGVGKFTTALYFGMALNCTSTMEKRPCGLCNSCQKFLRLNHPDFLYIFPTPKLDITLMGGIKSTKTLDEFNAYLENKRTSPWKEFFFSSGTGIRIESIRQLEYKISLSPNEATTKIFIIEDADQMTVQAANAFLKTLEEPPTDSVIILTTSKPNSLVPTILSRCQQVPFQAIPKKVIENRLLENKALDNVDARIYARIANGSLERALRLADEGRIQSREQTLDLLKLVITHNDLSFLDFALNYRSSKSQNILNEIISHLIIWITDLSYFHNDPQEIINLDKTDILETLYAMNPHVDEYAVDLISFLEDMQKKLDGHVNAELIIIEIYNRLCRILTGE
ncbi:MAG TPA: DNA polymerase III subunit delta' [Candidatus Cloacimonadota bacterium]|nr:DNA polymerase III subunit delta' [Candidatus Cloacimonadota bacterium]